MTLVTVIVPVHNGAATLAATLRSALAQTHRELEIIVVDDGSTDESAGIATALAAQDSRIRLISTVRQGVSAARNRGLAEAQGLFAAPLDADDLWHPRKLELQASALAAAGKDTVLAYGWFAPIGEDDRIFVAPKTPRIEGAVFHRHLDYNFISNGSSPLVRTAAARAIGYEPGLAFCEDYRFQLELALAGRFACVPAVLTGYRKLGRGVSSKVEPMLRAHIAVLSAFRSPERPEANRIIDRRIAEFETELARHRLRRLRFAGAAGAGLRALLHSPPATLRRAFGELRPALPAEPATGQMFPTGDPFAPIGVPIPAARAKRLAPLRILDETLDYLPAASSSAAARAISRPGAQPRAGRNGSAS